LKLNWPEAGDGRRAIYEWESAILNLKMQQFEEPLLEKHPYHFLNSTFDDINLFYRGNLHPQAQSALTTAISPRLLGPSRCLNAGYEIGLEEKHSVLLSYCKEYYLLLKSH